ncbi:hypothetical protein [Microbacterium sp. NPDC096154]|uniref:hypothetical protein n=1 Tax=Microbacterium sp. NPDC096154 TaxID=3155549 RepID=UPI003330617E
MNAELPDIHEWYPRLSIEAKHTLRDSAGDLPADVRGEIAEITGADVPEGASLSEDDRDFIRTQSEQVD